MDINVLLSNIAMGLLVIALPIVIVAAFQHFRVMTQQLRMKLSEEQQQNVDKAIKLGVQLAEQSGILKGLLGPEKKQEAIKVAEKFLADKGIKLDLDKLSTLIEAEVQTQFKSPTPMQDTPEARQALIDNAVRTAIQAAEQSGLTGVIQNLGPEKKAYAAGMALKFLDQYGIKIDTQLLSGLIEGHLMEALQQGRASQPISPAPTVMPMPQPMPAPQPMYAPPVPSAPMPVPVQTYAPQPPAAPPAGIVTVTPPQPTAPVSVMIPDTAPLSPPPSPPPSSEPTDGPAG